MMQEIGGKEVSRLDQRSLPLLEALRSRAAIPHARFYTPGHKGGQGAAAALLALLGRSALAADLPELPELDNLFAPEGVIYQAQALAAEAFGSDQTWFLANGSTAGIEAAVLATCQPGDKIILPRNSHQSAIAALILSGAVPVFIPPNIDARWGIAHPLTPDAVAQALKAHPDATAVMLVSPTYYGTCANVAAIAQLAHAHHIPLLVDEAHGAHFAFHPHLPSSALAAGADLAVQSTHKTLGALTQASMLHLRSSLVNPAQISRALGLVQSTSPNYLLLASLDAARQQMALQGESLLTRTLHLADTARTEINQLPGLSVLSPAGSTEFMALDRTRLTVDVSAIGLTGFAADEILHYHLGVTAELPSLHHLTFIITLGNTEQDIEQLIHAFHHLSHSKSNTPHASHPFPLCPSTSALRPALSPRQAFFAPTETVPIEQACDRISAELISPYPPGIPVLIPGELIARESLDYLQAIAAAGGMISGCADPELQTVQVIKASAVAKVR